MAKHSRRRRRARARRRIVDETLIRQCIIYAQSIAAYRAGFNIDPDSDSRHATALGEPYATRAQATLARIAATPALSVESLQAKARIVPIILSASYGSITGAEERLILSLANDVAAALNEITRLIGQHHSDMDPVLRHETRRR